VEKDSRKIAVLKKIHEQIQHLGMQEGRNLKVFTGGSRSR
jgi:hypothetical protein